MAKKRRKKERRVASVDAKGLLERDLIKTALWIGIAVVSVTIIALIERSFF